MIFKKGIPLQPSTFNSNRFNRLLRVFSSSSHQIFFPSLQPSKLMKNERVLGNLNYPLLSKWNLYSNTKKVDLRSITTEKEIFNKSTKARNSDNEYFFTSSKNNLLLGSMFTGALALYLYCKRSELSGFVFDNLVIHAKDCLGCEDSSQLSPCLGEMIEGLTDFTVDEVALHKTWDRRIWMIYKYGVYDLTDYIRTHPGGTGMLMAAGKRLDDFLKVYPKHCGNHILDTLENFRIGNCPEPVIRKPPSSCDPYRNDPSRLDVFIVNNEKPFEAEPATQLLGERFITPNQAYYINNHNPVPCINPNAYRLAVEHKCNEGKITLEELKCCFKKTSLISTSACAAIRRKEMHAVRPVKETLQNMGAISTAKWSGTTLNELLRHFGIDIDTVKEKHIIFDGLDNSLKDGQVYSCSIPVELARNLKDDIIIAYEMNGCPLPRDHGYPVKVVIPGINAAKNVKWLQKIHFCDQESSSVYQRGYHYRGYNASVTEHTAKQIYGAPILDIPVTSAICNPIDGQFLDEGCACMKVEGYAYSGGGRGIYRVDVSSDGGVTWHEATLFPNNQSKYKSYAWTLWEANVPVPECSGPVQLMCKAVDSSYNVQPDTTKGVWNFAGTLNNSWHRIQLRKKTDCCI